MGKVLFPDYFPFCLKDNYDDIPSHIRDDYFSGLAGSFDTLMAVYWRVRVWRVNYYGTSDEGVAVNGVGTYGFDVKTEEELVCPNPFIELSFSSSGPVLPSQWLDREFSIMWNENFSPNFDPFEYATNKLNQFAYSLFYQPGDDLSVGAIAFSEFRGNPIVNPNDPQILKVPIADAGTAYFPYNYDALNYPASIVITPQQYWSYDGTYNTFTGLPLNA